MKPTFASLLLFCIPVLAIAAGKPGEMTLTSKKQINVEKEVGAFYKKLISEDAGVKKQYEALIKDVQDEEGGNFYTDTPKVIEWYPTEDSWDVAKGDDSDETYLVLQNIGMGRSRYARFDDAVVAEFHVIYKSISKPDPKNPDGESTIFVSNTVTITFQGFRTPDLESINPDTGKAVDSTLKEADAHLNTLYKETLGKLDAAGKKKLIASELAWLAYRDSQAALQENVSPGDTTPGSASTAGQARLDLTIERIATLENLFPQ